jgi:hypothetical protein
METRKDGTTFMPLPSTMHKPITGGCECPFCHAHPDKTPMWDTLAGHPDKRYTWVVHYPELAK